MASAFAGVCAPTFTVSPLAISPFTTSEPVLPVAPVTKIDLLISFPFAIGLGSARLSADNASKVISPGFSFRNPAISAS